MNGAVQPPPGAGAGGAIAGAAVGAGGAIAGAAVGVAGLAVGVGVAVAGAGVGVAGLAVGLLGSNARLQSVFFSGLQRNDLDFRVERLAQGRQNGKATEAGGMRRERRCQPKRGRKND